ncbi:MAG: DUF6456 domain-containing protein [Pseudomonadota bacterium]
MSFIETGEEFARARAARRILPLLLSPSACIVIAAPHILPDAEAAVVTSAGDVVEVIEKVDRKTFDTLRAEGWVDLHAESEEIQRYRITSHGRASIAEAAKIVVDRGARPDPLEPYFRGADPLSQDAVAAAAAIRSEFARAKFSGDELFDEWREFTRSGEWPGDLEDLPDSDAFARSTLRALLARLGPDLGDMVILVVCLFRSVPDAEKTLNLPQRSGRVLLRMALDRAASAISTSAPATPEIKIAAPSRNHIRAQVEALPEGERTEYLLALIEALLGPELLSPAPWRAFGLELTPNEVRVAFLLAAHRGSLVSRERIFAALYVDRAPGDELPSIDTIRNVISHLRKKFEEADCLLTIEAEPGFGYRLDAPEEIELPGDPKKRK